VEQAANDAVVRLRQDLAGGEARVGAIFSVCERQGADADLQTLPQRALVYGADAARYFAERSYIVEGRVLASVVTGTPEAITALMESPVHDYQRADADYVEVDPAATRLTGNAGYLRAGRIAGRWRGSGFVSWRSPGVDFNDLGYLQAADQVTPGVQVQYYDATAGTLLRRRDLRLKVTESENYGGDTLGRSALLETEFATMAGAYFTATLGAETALLDPHVLRGGEALRLADRYPFYFYGETPGGRPLQYKFTGDASTSAEKGALSLRLAPGMEWKAGDHLKTGLTIDYQHNRQPTQYAGTTAQGGTPLYLMGRLDQQVLAATCRVTVNFTPALSLSYYGGPFVTTGRYNDFKVVAHPRAAAVAERFDRVALTPTLAGPLTGEYGGAPLELSNPDFNWREFKSNLVLRWEYRPGSFIYGVWSQYRSDAAEIGGFAAGRQYERLFSAHPDNTLLLKVSYWFSI